MLEAKKLLPLLLTCAVSARAEAQLLPTFDDYAAAIVTGMGARWDGPRVPWPMEHDRPVTTEWLVSDHAPIRVHGGEENAPRLAIALRGAETMRAHLERLGWASMPLDAHGPDGGFDLYLGAGPSTWEAYSDGPRFPSALDAVTVHAVVSDILDPLRLEACAMEAYAGALLFSLDPAEAPAWRRATANYLAYTITGRFDGCAENVDLAQLDPTRTWVGEDAQRPGGALLLALLADRHDGGSGTFVRELWSMARQWTWEGEGLRASPDVWEALARAMQLSGIGFEDTMIDVAIARAMPSVLATTRNAELPTIRAMPRHLGAYIANGRVLADLPSHLPQTGLIAKLGSSYTHLDVHGAARGARVRVWLRGEIATRWSLAVVGFDAAGREVSRVRAPITEREERAYVPYELEPRITDVLVVVTNIGEARPDADVEDTGGNAHRLILDLAAPGDLTGAP